MTHSNVAAPSVDELVDQLTRHKTLAGAPRAELEWLARHGEYHWYPAGPRLMAKGDPINEMIVQLDGRVSVNYQRGSGREHLLDTVGGDITAALPFSRAAAALGDVTVAEDTSYIALPRGRFRDLVQECPVLIEIIVHAMLDRTRHISSASWQDDKMSSLGRLAAGLAHELNNPASAAARSAKRLQEALAEADDASQSLGAADLSADQRGSIAAFGSGSAISGHTGVFSAIERADHEEVVSDWLDEHSINGSLAAALAESGVTTDALDELAGSLPSNRLEPALRWFAAEFTVRTLAMEVERATTRIHDLVSAVKRFTYMNRASGAEPTNISQGLSDTITVVTSKARAKSVAIRLEVAPALPTIVANAGELNQVWANLIENAIDAVSEGGEVSVSASVDGPNIVVRVIDNGSGVPPELQETIFEPFFTTKPIGQGTGLGLDISRRIVVEHNGTIALQTRPGRTEFRVTLPIERH